MAVSRNTRLRWSWPQFVKFQFAIAVEVIGNDCKQSGSRNNSLFHSFVLLFQWRQRCVSMMPGYTGDFCCDLSPFDACD